MWNVYRMIRGVPVLTPKPHAPKVRLNDDVGRPISPALRDRLSTLDGYWLNLGAGATEEPPPNCIELDTHVFRNTTLSPTPHGCHSPTNASRPS